MSDDREPGPDDGVKDGSQGPSRREALNRFAKYTAPAMLALLLSQKAFATVSQL